MEKFIWENRTKVYFGKGCVKEYLPGILAAHPEVRKVLMGYGGGSIKKNGAYNDVRSVLDEAGVDVTEFSGIMSNPTYDKMLEGARLAYENKVDLILAVGGGSVMDCCKSISVAAAYAKAHSGIETLSEDNQEVWDEFWDKQGTMDFETVPLGMVVTMPATGSEVNGSAVLTNTTVNIKTDRDYLEWNARFALMDPVYTYTMPIRQLRAGSFDILSHIMETYFSFPIEDNVSDDVSEALMRGVIRDLRAALKDPEDYQARSNLMWEASMAEIRIIKCGKTKDFEVHNMEHQLSAFTNCNHGEGLGILHPNYYRHVYKYGLGKFVKFAENVWGIEPEENDEATALAGIDALESFIKEIGMPQNLREIGIESKTLLRSIADSCFVSEGAYKQLTKNEIYEIFLECF